MRRWRAALVAAVAVGTLLGGLPALDAFDAGAPAGAAGLNHAAVIVDDGHTVTKTVVSFPGDSISGIEALQLAGQDPTVRGFSGLGAAVCAIRHVGCSAGNDCMTCGAPAYWAYYRASAGAAGYTKSPVGGGATRVHDGDVEGWHWSSGTPPPFATVAQIGLPPPPPAPAPAPAVTTAAPGSPPVSGSGTGAATGTGTTAPASGTTVAPEGAAGSSAPASGADPRVASGRAHTVAKPDSPSQDAAGPPARVGSGDGGSSAVAWGLFGALLAAMAAGFFVIRRRRGRVGS